MNRKDQLKDNGNNLSIIQLPADEDSINTQTLLVDNKYFVTDDDTVVVILSYGRVASKSIVQSLHSIPSASAVYPIYHIHNLSPNDRTINESLARFQNRKVLPHQLVALALKRKLDRYREKLRWKFITGVREPVSLYISQYYFAQGLTTDESARIIPLQNIIDQGNIMHSERKLCYPYDYRELLGIPSDHKFICDYFTYQFEEILGINIFDHPFNKELGYSIVKSDNVEILLYKYEHLHEIWPEAIRNLLGLENIELKNTNHHQDKKYSNLYKSTIAKLQLSDSSLDSIYSSKTVQYFYSDKEIQAFKKKWQRRQKPKAIRRNHFWPRYFYNKVNDINIAYLAIGKSAATSFKLLIASLNDDVDMTELYDDIGRVHFCTQRYMSIASVAEGLPPNSFSFTFVRNPYTKFMSFYRNKIIHWDEGLAEYFKFMGFYPKMPMLECLNRISQLKIEEMNNHFVPQAAFLFRDGKKTVDFIGKIENLSHDIKVLEMKIGRPISLDFTNVTKGKFNVQINEEIINKIYEIYKIDFDTLDYPKYIDINTLV